MSSGKRGDMAGLGRSPEPQGRIFAGFSLLTHLSTLHANFGFSGASHHEEPANSAPVPVFFLRQEPELLPPWSPARACAEQLPQVGAEPH